MVVDNAVYRLSISPSILEIFALKVESCPKSRRILDVFAIPNFKGAVPPPNLYARYQRYLALHHVAKFS